MDQISLQLGLQVHQELEGNEAGLSRALQAPSRDIDRETPS